MLILTRRPGETLIIESPAGEQIKVTVLGIKGNQVRIGTAAPDDMGLSGRSCWTSCRLRGEGLQSCIKKPAPWEHKTLARC